MIERITKRKKLDSFLRGIARIFDVFGTLSDKPDWMDEEDPWEADRKALESDWKAVGDDMRRAMEEYKSNNGLHF